MIFLQEEDAKKLVRDAIAAGIFNDMGSGSNIDLCVIKANDQVEYLRGYDIANVKGERKKRYDYEKGSTAILNESRRPVFVDSTTVRPVPMETDYVVV